MPIERGIKWFFQYSLAISPKKNPRKIPSRYCAHSTIGNKQIEYSLILLIFYQHQTLTQAPFHLCEYLKSRREKHNEYLLLK